MRLRPYILALLIFPTVAVTAQDNDQERVDIEQHERLEFRRDSRSESQRYSFEDYIQDLTAAARSDEPRPDNPVSQLAPNDRREHEYKPLNPIPLLRW
jgi:hypothetical protein